MLCEFIIKFPVQVYHGYNGELRIEAPDYIGTAPEFVQAAMEFGYPNRDLNSAPYSEGCSHHGKLQLFFIVSQQE